VLEVPTLDGDVKCGFLRNAPGGVSGSAGAACRKPPQYRRARSRWCPCRSRPTRLTPRHRELIDGSRAARDSAPARRPQGKSVFSNRVLITPRRNVSAPAPVHWLPITGSRWLSCARATEAPQAPGSSTRLPGAQQGGGGGGGGGVGGGGGWGRTACVRFRRTARRSRSMRPRIDELDEGICARGARALRRCGTTAPRALPRPASPIIAVTRPMHGSVSRARRRRRRSERAPSFRGARAGGALGSSRSSPYRRGLLPLSGRFHSIGHELEIAIRLARGPDDCSSSPHKGEPDGANRRVIRRSPRPGPRSRTGRLARAIAAARQHRCRESDRAARARGRGDPAPACPPVDSPCDEGRAAASSREDNFSRPSRCSRRTTTSAPIRGAFFAGLTARAPR